MLFLSHVFGRLSKIRLVSFGLILIALFVLIDYNDDISTTLYALLATNTILGLLGLCLYFGLYIFILSLLIHALLNIILKLMDFLGK